MLRLVRGRGCACVCVCVCGGGGLNLPSPILMTFLNIWYRHSSLTDISRGWGGGGTWPAAFYLACEYLLNFFFLKVFK